MEKYESELNLKATELRLGLPGSDEPEKSSCTSNSVRSKKRSSPESSEEESVNMIDHEQESAPQPAKVQLVGWPPVKSHRKNVLAAAHDENGDGCGKFVKVSMAGAAYLRKMDLKVYKNYPELLMALESMFKCSFGEYSEREGYNGSEYSPTYEDKDGDWMLVGDVPWNMFMCSCKRLRIVEGSKAKGLGCL